ncbi:MAG: YqgE/AlgH family protein [Bacteroidetes bacterium]|nr:YqgE/AlgH family protein [Bacteroidota bacterium]
MQYSDELERWEQHIWATMPAPAAGMLLVANPFMQDPNFRRTVVLLVLHAEEEGTLGFVLNRPLDARVNEVVGTLGGFSAPLLQGGPVELDTLHFVHRMGTAVPGACPVTPEIAWAGDFDWLSLQAALGQLPEDDFRFFLGYSGWAAGQLAAEQQQRSWLVCPASPFLVFNTTPEDIWVQAIRHMGGKVAHMVHFPEDPSQN